MIIKENEFVVAKDLSFKGILSDVKKSNTSLAPVFEAFTNALESIKIKKKINKDFGRGKICFSIFVNDLLDKSFEFSKIEIFDNGVGFDEKEFTRFNTFKDNSKGYKNLGSGRIQYVHFFDNTEIESFYNQDEVLFKRKFILSKNKAFLDKNAIVKSVYCKPAYESETHTNVVFRGLLEQSLVYNSLDDKILKDELLKRYLNYFCFNAEDIPEIFIGFYVRDVCISTSQITKYDIPKCDKRESILIPYSKLGKDARSIEQSDKNEKFSVATFKMTKGLLKINDINLISKGEVVEGSKISLTTISKNDTIGGNKYLVLVSGDYIDEKDTNVRGELDIPFKVSADSFNLFNKEIIALEKIQESVNEKLVELYPEIKKITEKHKLELQQIKEMFLIADDKDIDISLNDSDVKILEKYYEAQAKKEARVDADLKHSIDRLNRLDTTSNDYEVELEQEINRIVKIIPEQNKRTLSHYIARRKLVIELFSKILDRKLNVQSGISRDKDEALIHNLLFHQKSTDTYGSDLWLITEEFIYFKGASEFKLKDLEIDGVKVFKKEFEEEEEKFLNSLGENRIEKRPDVLLFPEEGKCIIIEFKAPKVNASEHLNQINKYASLIRNYSSKKFEIKTFYGYLIGESIEPRDILGSVSTFEHSYHFDYLYNPSQKVIGFDGKESGSIYTEVLKYSSLLKRAELRNRIFIEKLGL